MIYENHHGKATTIVDSIRVADRFMNRHHIYVRPTCHEERIKVIELLEADGFSCKVTAYADRDGAIASDFPLSIGLDSKEYSVMGSITCAAAACGSHIVASEKEFYVLYACRSRLLSSSNE